ncbi:E3 ubiquitin-protein ligase LRSAM1 [Echinococcus granulosus]|uniref:E3 ubiquitin-protein ligase LRSAM1 n=1 Tax=Echinococcus granulosus TaxID=6210 RepID=W6UGE7_ECHGR|nr:E3 ubiquitin-protein ligase LRSAM1 [Echinococcus granulosus]EUB57217.1 E3 ubiquitin-protein ligase LRSAM1 [Echinococcus granulosus]
MGRCKGYGGGGWHPPKKLYRQVEEHLCAHEEMACRAAKSRVSSLNKLAQKEGEMKSELEQLRKQREERRLELVATLRDTLKHVDDPIRHLHQKQWIQREDNQPQFPIKHPCETITSDHREMIPDSVDARLDTSRTGLMRCCGLREDCLTRANGQDEIDSELQCILVSRQAERAQLAAQVANERQQIVDNIRLVETELCSLTQVERERKKSQSALVVVHFSERQRHLVHLMSELQHQKEHRESDLRELLKELEEQRERDQTEYWLVQYQRLIDKKPLNLKKELLMGDDVCALPAAPIASEHVGNFENHHSPSDMPTSLAVEDTILDSLPVLSAPSEKANGGGLTMINTGDNGMVSPSAPPAIIARFESECCICQDAQCSIIFLPCGHVCCCKLCSAKVILCPLCRNTVEQHIQLP